MLNIQMSTFVTQHGCVPAYLFFPVAKLRVRMSVAHASPSTNAFSPLYISIMRYNT